MKISVVTISFNQAEFLERAICSVLNQNGFEIEYIIVDPGSTDGSREVIERYRDRFAHVILEKDDGPADGLNKGFARASGDIYCYLNSDDEFEPGAFERILSFFTKNPDTDVVCGHAWVVDETGEKLRRVWSDPYNRVLSAYGAAIQIQPSTFIRARAFRKVGGFNPKDRTNWDGGLLCDLFIAGFRIAIINEFLSFYRVHRNSITGGGVAQERLELSARMRFRKLMGRDREQKDRYWVLFFRIVRQFRHPRASLERFLRGPVYRRAS
jgi:glycosyltransferase involved in cell wall biosynthesis